MGRISALNNGIVVNWKQLELYVCKGRVARMCLPVLFHLDTAIFHLVIELFYQVTVLFHFPWATLNEQRFSPYNLEWVICALYY